MGNCEKETGKEIEAPYRRERSERHVFMKKKNLFQTAYDKLCKGLSIRTISLLTLLLFLALLLPICYLSFVNRATGDDLGYGAYTRAAWMASHSLVKVAEAIWVTIREYYYSWQGTWFSIAVFALQPEVFSDQAYVIVVFLMLFSWIGSTLLLFWQIFKKEYGLESWSVLLITLLCLILGIQFVPSTASSIFWFNGCAHYMLPFVMCQVTVWCLIRFLKNFQVRYLIWITVLTFFLGGSNYQAALFALIVLFYAGSAGWFRKKNKKVFLLTIPFMLEMIGLVISMKAPGNKVRGGEEFGLSIEKAARTVIECFVEGERDFIGYLQEKPMIFLGLAVLFLVMLEAFKGSAIKGTWKQTVIAIIALLCLYCAMQAPALYAGVEVSRGVYNMNFMVFLLAMIGSLGMIAILISGKMQSSKEEIHKRVTLPGMVICLVLMFFCRSNIKSSTSWICLEYIRSGQAADYKVQMDLQTSLLTDKDREEVCVPMVNDVQGPLMSMPITEDPEAWTNMVTCEFYEKKSVVGMPRDEWEEMYERR